MTTRLCVPRRITCWLLAVATLCLLVRLTAEDRKETEAGGELPGLLCLLLS